MERVFKNILVLVLIVIHGQIMSQNSVTVELSSSMNDFQLINSGANKYIIEPYELEYYFNDGQDLPAIPIKNISVLVPNGAEMVDYDFSIQRTMLSKDIEIDLSPAIMPTLPGSTNTQKEFVFNGLYPENPIQFSSVSVQRGFTQLNFSFSPFIYDGENLTLEFISNLKLNVSYTINESKRSSIRADESLVQVIKQRIANPDALEKLYGNSLLHGKSAEEKVDYLIVTSKDLEESFTPLIQWKNRKGLYAKVVTVEDIYQQYDEPTNQLKIKKCLLEYYKNHDLKWVLLGGDVDIVPVQHCHNILEKEVIRDVNTIPTDLFYACLDSRFDWNSHEDDIIGELFWDGHDITPEVYLTRLPVNTKEETEAVVGKILKYESNPDISNSIGKFIFAGVKLYSNWADKSDSHHRSEYIYRKYIEKNTTGDNFYFFDTGTDFNDGANHDVTSVNLTKKLNDGFGVLHFTGHGNYQSLIMESGNDFDINDALNLSNQIGGIVFTNACWTNAFDITEPSFSEALIRNPNGGCVAYFGSSRYGFGNPQPSSKLGTSLRYNAKFIEYIFNKKLSGSMTFGEIATNTKNEFNAFGRFNRFFSYLLYAINPIGDPELPLYKGIPKTFQNIRIYEMGDLLYINTGGVENARICITSINLDDGFKSVVENVSHQSFENLPEQFQITITAPNYKPYTYVSGIATGISSNIRALINVFPNPASDYVHVDFNFPNGRLQIYDVNGKLLKERLVSFGTNNINISDLPDGFLILNFITKEGSARYKIVKHDY